jgi:large subunit ribosomal protein L25
MLTISAKIRKATKKKVKALRNKGIIPAVLYGPKTKNTPIEINAREFEKIFKEAGESSLISLEVEGKKEKAIVLIHDFKKEPFAGKIIHVDFYQPALDKEIEAHVALVFEGEAPAVKELGGTLVKNFSEIEVRALPQNLPKEIKVDVSLLKTFEDNVLIKDLLIPPGVKVMKKHAEEIVASVTPLEKVEEELEKPIEEKVEEVEKVEKKKKEEEEVVEVEAGAKTGPKEEKKEPAGGEKKEAFKK